MAASCNCRWAGLLAEERDPRRYIMAERSSEKLSTAEPVERLAVALVVFCCDH